MTTYIVHLPDARAELSSVHTALSSSQFAGRWRKTCPLRSEPLVNSDEEDKWRKTRLELLSAAHTIGNMNDLEFDIVPTRYSVCFWRYLAITADQSLGRILRSN